MLGLAADLACCCPLAMLPRGPLKEAGRPARKPGSQEFSSRQTAHSLPPISFADDRDPGPETSLPPIAIHLIICVSDEQSLKQPCRPCTMAIRSDSGRENRCLQSTCPAPSCLPILVVSWDLVPVPLRSWPAQGGDGLLLSRPSGNDQWSGRLAAPNGDASDGPFATLQKARDAIRAVEEVHGPAGGRRDRLDRRRDVPPGARAGADGGGFRRGRQADRLPRGNRGAGASHREARPSPAGGRSRTRPSWPGWPPPHEETSCRRTSRPRA